MVDYLKKIEDKEAEFYSLFARMDKDKDLYFLKPFVLKDKQGREVPRVENMTLNDPRYFAERVMSILSGAEMQIVVEGDLSDRETSLIEDWLRDIYWAIDDRLLKRGIPGLFPFQVEQICLRGFVGARSLLRTEGERFIPDVLPVDMRYLVYELGEEGARWEAYKTQRTKDQIAQEYGYEMKGSSAEVIDFWDEKYERVFIDRKQRREQEHNLGYVPFVIGKSTSGSMLQDRDAFQHSGESLFGSVREICAGMNKFSTVLNTLTMLSFRQGLQFKNELGALAPKPDIPPYGEDFIVPIGLQEQYLPMPVSDIRNASRLLYSILEQRFQRGGLSAVDYGNLTFPLSAVAIRGITALREAILIPRVKALRNFYRELSYMMKRQYVEGGIKAKLGKENKKREYSAKDLDKECYINIDFVMKNPEEDIANYSVAAAARPFVSLDTIRRDILKLADPSAEENKRLTEMSEGVSPHILLYRIGKALIEADRDEEAKIIANQLGITLKQLEAGEIEAKPEKVEEKAPPSMLPLLASERGAKGGIMRQGRPTEEISPEGEEE